MMPISLREFEIESSSVRNLKKSLRTSLRPRLVQADTAVFHEGRLHFPITLISLGRDKSTGSVRISKRDVIRKLTFPKK